MKNYEITFSAEYCVEVKGSEIPEGLTIEEYAEELWAEGEFLIDGHETIIEESGTTQVVWRSELIASMVGHLEEDEQGELFEQLNDAVMEVCDIYKVGESFTGELGRWLTYTYTCDPEGDDSLLEITTHKVINQPLCPVCNKSMNLISIKDGQRTKGFVVL